MFRRGLLRLANGSAPATPSGAGAGAGAAKPKTADILSMRQAPRNLYRSGMTSNTLSEHTLTHKAQVEESKFRQQLLADRGEFEAAAQAAATTETAVGAQRAREYKWILLSALAGALAAHSVIFPIYYPEDVRMTYDPKGGYISDVAAHRQQLQALDEHIHGSLVRALGLRAPQVPSAARG